MNLNRLLTYYLIILFITSFSFEIGYVFISSFYNSELICLVDLDTESEKTDNEDIKENKEKILSNEICGLSELDQFLSQRSPGVEYSQQESHFQASGMLYAKESGLPPIPGIIAPV